MRFSIIQKLRKIHAVSAETAVTLEEANLNQEEMQWLKVLVGAFSPIKKTKDGKYYTLR
jgi:hypothetical protein